MTFQLINHDKQVQITTDNGATFIRAAYYVRTKNFYRVFLNGNGFILRVDGNGIITVEDNTQVVQLAVEAQITVDFDAVVYHKDFNVIKNCVQMDIPVYLYGPAGSGKNYTLQMIADQLHLDFYFTNAVQEIYNLTGFIDANGKFHETEFYKAFSMGGMFFLDEMDASIPDVLVKLNAAIANRYFDFPNGKITAHKDFRVVAAGNTVGSGANELYTGRQVIDAASLDRFVAIPFGYDVAIEMALANNNTDLVHFIHNMREIAEQNGIRATFSYRAIISTVKLEKTGMDLSKILDIAIFKGLDKSTINTMTKSAPLNKYGYALKKLAM